MRKRGVEGDRGVTFNLYRDFDLPRSYSERGCRRMIPSPPLFTIAFIMSFRCASFEHNTRETTILLD